jgi:cytochrome oxidase Cu insertion factor (SCO1/SenC/PrrC family)
MKKYFGLYKLDPSRDKRWMFVSGEVNELSVLWKYYGIEVEKVEEKMLPEGYYMEYTPKLVLIDKKGVIRHEENFFFDDEDIVKKIRKIT